MAIFEGGQPRLAGCSRLPQIELESDDVAKAHEIVKETTEARLKTYLAQKNLGRHCVGAFEFVKNVASVENCKQNGEDH